VIHDRLRLGLVGDLDVVVDYPRYGSWLAMAPRVEAFSD
jgi:hypothetical protein